MQASCVGCGVWSAVCPRGVLRLEGAETDIAERTDQQRTVTIQEEGRDTVRVHRSKLQKTVEWAIVVGCFDCVKG